MINSSFENPLKMLNSLGNDCKFQGISMLYPRRMSKFVNELKNLIWFSIKNDHAKGFTDKGIFFTLPVDDNAKILQGGFGIGTRNIESLTLRFTFSLSSNMWRDIRNFLRSYEIPFYQEERFYIVNILPEIGGFYYQLAFSQAIIFQHHSYHNLPTAYGIQDFANSHSNIENLISVFYDFGVSFWGLHHVGISIKADKSENPQIDPFIGFLAYIVKDWQPGGLFHFVADRAAGQEWYFLIPRMLSFPPFEFIFDKYAPSHVQFDIHVRLPTNVVRSKLQLHKIVYEPSPGFLSNFMTDVLIFADISHQHIVMINDENNSTAWVPELIAARELQLIMPNFSA